MENPLHSWEEGIPAEDIAFALAPLLAQYRQNIDRMVQPFGLSAGQAPLVVILSHRDGIPQKDLAAMLQVTPPSLATMLHRMERAGFVERKRPADNQRVCHVYLTPSGKRISRKIQAVVRFANRRNLRGFTAQEQQQFAAFFRRMRANVAMQAEELQLIVERERENARRQRPKASE